MGFCLRAHRFLIASFLGAAILAAAGPSGRAEEAAPDSKPKLKSPTYPNEPNKKPSEPVKPETYVEGPSEAPVVPEDLIPRITAADNEWARTFRIRWFYAHEVQDHSYDAGQSAHAESNSIYDIGGRMDLRAPWAPLSLMARAAISPASVETRPSSPAYSVTNYNSTTAEAFGGLRLHLFRRSSDHDVGVGLDGGWRTSSYSVLPTGGSGLTAQARGELLLMPTAEYRYTKGNWTADFLLRYALSPKVLGSGDLAVTGYRRIEGEIGLSRYVDQGTALGLGVEYQNERGSWSESTPLAFHDFSIVQDLRLNLFIRFED